MGGERGMHGSNVPSGHTDFSGSLVETVTVCSSLKSDFPHRRSTRPST